jgi:ATP-dependent DNA helicase RecQ
MAIVGAWKNGTGGWVSAKHSTLQKTLQHVFGYSSFRPGQREAIEAMEAGRDVQVLLPTGGGKSVCYQLPAVRGSGPMVVVSPLIALMEDQVGALTRRGIPAVAMHTGKDWEQVKADRELAAEARLVYVSPERLKAKRFRAWLAKLRPMAFAIDEAHCISEWGHDFRPDYARLGVLKEEFGLPVIALTATATRRVMGEIRESLGMEDPCVILGDFARPNLTFSVELLRGDKARTARVGALLRESLQEGGRAIVYAATRKRTKKVADQLKIMGFRAGHYHGGRTAGARTREQERFEVGKLQVLVATSAFGMGVDLPDVRAVIHAEAPATLESYYQEAGRAGRDGDPARAVLLYSPKDALTRQRIRGQQCPPGVEQGWHALMDYVYGTHCRQGSLIHHFTERDPGPCGRCDVCMAPEQVLNQVVEERKLLAKNRQERQKKNQRENAVVLDETQRQTVISFVENLKKPLGKRLIAMGLKGSHSKAAKRKKLRENPCFGSLRGIPEIAVVKAISELQEEGRLAAKGRKYPTVWIPDKRVRAPVSRKSSKSTPAETSLAGALKRFRTREARRRRFKAYQVFNNATLKEISEVKPSDMETLLSVKGMGPVKIKKYGTQILELVAQFTDPPPL